MIWKGILIGVINLIVGLLVGLLLTRHFINSTINTVSIHDTIFRDSIQIKEIVKWKYRTTHDTIIEHVPIVIDKDTIALPVDTIHIPIDHYEYSDSTVTDSSRIAWSMLYSGYQAKIDTFKLDYKFTPKLPLKEKKRGWGQYIGVGLQIGYGAGVLEQRVYMTPFIGVGITYGFGYAWLK